MSPPIVFATLVPINRNAMKLKKAAQAIATNGVRTRVDTTVAMELAASWNPLTKSNSNVKKMMTIVNTSEALLACTF